METTLQKTQEKPDIEQSLKARANAIALVDVVDSESFERAALNVGDLVEIKKSWTGYWEKIKGSAHETWKGIVAKEKALVDVVEKKVADQKALAKKWSDAEEKKRLEAQRIAQAQADKEAKEALKNQVKELKRLGEDEAAAALKEAPPPPPQVVLPTSIPQGHGRMTQKFYSAVVVDLMSLAKAVIAGKVPLAAIQGNDTYLNNQARQLKETLNYPGVRLVVK